MRKLFPQQMSLLLLQRSCCFFFIFIFTIPLFFFFIAFTWLHLLPKPLDKDTKPSKEVSFESVELVFPLSIQSCCRKNYGPWRLGFSILMETRRNQSAQFDDIPGIMKLSCFSRSIKESSFLPSFSFHTLDHDSSSKKVLQFFVAIETDFMEDPFWEQMNIFDCALERKNYWKPNPLKPLATSCCTLISNLMLDTSTSKDLILGGADEFWPLLIYVTIKANPSHLLSNLKSIQLYRRKAKIVSEDAYYLTYLVLARTLIIELTGKSLSSEETEVQQQDYLEKQVQLKC